jgi:hypothetical protein
VPLAAASSRQFGNRVGLCFFVVVPYATPRKPSQLGRSSERAHDALCRQARIDPDRQGFPYTFIEHVQDPKASSIILPGKIYCR